MHQYVQLLACSLTNVLKSNWINLMHALETSFCQRKKATNGKNICIKAFTIKANIFLIIQKSCVIFFLFNPEYSIVLNSYPYQYKALIIV